MRRFLDTRLARMAKTAAPSDLPAARHHTLLRARVAVCALLRERSTPADADRALAGAFELGDTAAAELADIPDTPELRKTDAVLLARDHAGAEEAFETQLWHLVRQCVAGRELDPANAAPAELLAAHLAETANGGNAGSEALG